MQGDLKQAIEYASKNPTSNFANELTKLVQSGSLDSEANRLGINLGPIKSTTLPNTASNTASQDNTFQLPGQETAKNISMGFAKGALSTIGGITKLGKSVATGLGNLVGIKESKVLNSSSELNKLDTLTTPQNTAESIGKNIEQLAEFFIPAGKTARAEEAVNLIAKGIKNPLLASATKVVGKAGVQGLSGGVVTLAQTGDIKEAGKTAATAGLFRGTMATIGEGARALKIPERMYSTIFKNSSQDMINELKSGGIENLRQTNPSKYEDFVKQGIIKTDETGNPIVNTTLAEQALDKGLRGSIKSMANEVVDGTLTSENNVRNIARNYTGTIDLSEPQIKNVLNKIGTDYEDVGFGEISNSAKELARQIESTGGKVSAETAVDVRRLLDKVRVSTSFDKPASALSQTQGNLKTLSDVVRKRVNDIPGMGKVMNDYSFYIDALETLANEAKRRGNNQVIGLIDAAFLSGIPSNPVTSATLSTLQKILRSVYGSTKLAQILNNPNIGTKASGILTSGSAGVQSNLTNQ